MWELKHTRYCSAATAPAVVIDDDSITLDGAIDREIAPVSGIGDLSIFEDLACNLDGVNSTSAISKQEHACFGRTVETSI